MPDTIKKIRFCITIFAWSAIVLVANSMPSTATIAEGVLAYELGNYHKAREEWLPYAALGNPNALYNLAQLYRMGRGVEINFEKAEEYYLRAADKDHVGAQRNLGTLYYFSRLGEENRQNAFGWLKKAAINGDSRAQLMIGTMLYNGEIVDKDSVAAYAWIMLAARQGLMDALAAEKKMLALLDQKQIERSRKIAPSMLTRYQTPDDVGLMVNHDIDTPEVKTLEIKLETDAPMAAEIPAETDSATVDDTYRIQIAAFRTEDNAHQAWEKLLKKFPEILTSLDYDVQYADLGPDKGIYYRLQLTSFSNRTDAKDTCSVLKDNGQGCFVVNSPN